MSLQFIKVWHDRIVKLADSRQFMMTMPAG